ncbi:MAG TPA: rubrerythrin family protein [Syntrophales bacterium]|nr:rubrerythrin family protein [Syntrophales bacterium]
MAENKTKDNLLTAFVGEAKAYFRLQAFAERAEKEGFPQIAALFRAVSAAEAVHAASHFALLERTGTTEENLKSSFEKETFANQVAYPEFLKTAWAEGDKQAVWALTKARNAEERHAKLYKFALAEMVGDRRTVYYVCSVCGWIADGARPESCPNCQAPAEKYRKIE